MEEKNSEPIEKLLGKKSSMYIVYAVIAVVALIVSLISTSLSQRKYKNNISVNTTNSYTVNNNY